MDDGSVDNTKELIQQFKQESDFPIEYFYKDNGGKHTALNLGISKIDSELTFIVDSDDTLTSDAVETISYYHNKYKNEDDICGYSFLRQFPNGKINGKLFKPDERIGTHIDCRINSDDIYSDKAEVYKTKCLKEYPFPVFKDEKFLGEDIIWIRMSLKYKTVYINKPIYIGNYLEDGLTKNRRINNIKSPNGCLERAKEFLRPEIKFKYRLKGAIQYIVYGKFAGKNLHELYKNTSYKAILILPTIPGLLIYLKWKKEYT